MGARVSVVYPIDWELCSLLLSQSHEKVSPCLRLAQEMTKIRSAVSTECVLPLHLVKS